MAGFQEGANTVVLMGFEAVGSPGTAAVTGIKIPVNSETLNGTKARNQRNTLTGSRNPKQPFAGNRQVSGGIVGPVDSVVFYYMAKAMFGDPTQTGSDPYVYEFKLPSSGSNQPYLTLEKAFADLTTDRYSRFLGNKVDTFSIDVGGDGELTYAMNFFGMSDTVATSPFDATPVEPTLTPVDNFQAAITEGGSSSSVVSRFSLNLDFGLDKRDDLVVIGNNGVRTAVPTGILGVSGSITVLLDDDGYNVWAKAIADTESSLKLTVTGSASSVFEIEIQELLYDRAHPAVPGPQGILLPLNFQGYYTNGSEASAVVFRITNSTDHGVGSASASPSASASASASSSVSASASSSASPSS